MSDGAYGHRNYSVPILSKFIALRSVNDINK